MENQKIVLWVDDVRDPPNRPNEKYIIARSVNQAIQQIELSDQDKWEQWYIDGIPQEQTKGIDIIDLDHDSGDYYADGGNYINILNYLEKRAFNGYKINFNFRIHSQNVVGRMNMRTIIQTNGWKEVY